MEWRCSAARRTSRPTTHWAWCTAACCAVHTQLPAGVGFSSIEIKVSFLRPANGAALEIEGQALRVGRQVAFAEAHARDEDGKLVGHATSSIALLRP
jgi:uncharacterized protein (TIGR00369 family)